LITAFDVVSLVNAVAQQFPRLAIDSCYLSLYDGDARPPEHARLVLAYDSRQQREPSSPDRSFPCSQLVPADLLPQDRQSAYIVEPLFFKEEQLGFVLFEIGPREGAVYEALRDEISAAIKGARLVQQVVEKDQERQRLLRDLERRARQLEDTYQALKDNQEKLLTQEKMANLGRLTASIAHEMNTPLAAVRTALLELETLTEEYAASSDDPAVTPQDHAEIAEEMRRTITLAANSARKAADFVRGIKTQTRDLSPAESMTFDAVPYVREALLLLTYSLRQGECEARLTTSDDRISLRGSPGRLAQIVTNLVTNSIEATVPKGGGLIELDLSRKDDRICLRVTDDGCGIEPAVLPKIFNPLFTTKPLGHGTGLGLSIVRDIITRDFCGTIDVVSTPGLGTTFRIDFPSVGPDRP
jgi:signal transduction histidine kinase